MKNHRFHRIFSILAVLTLLLTMLSPINSAGVKKASAADPYTSYFPQLPINISGIHSVFTFFNPNASSSMVKLSFFGPMGYFNEKPFSIPAMGTLEVHESDLPDLQSGNYNMTMSSTQPFRGLVTVFRHYGNILSTYLGQFSGSNNLVFGPLYRTSALAGQNIGYSPTAIFPELYDNQGVSLYAPPFPSVPPGASFVYVLSSPTFNIPTDFLGMMVINSQTGLAGLLFQREFTPGGIKGVAMNPGLVPATLAYLPRVFKAVNEDGGARTSQVFVGNPGASSITVTLSFVSAAGAISHSLPVTLDAKHSTIVDLDQQPDFETGQTWAVQATSLDNFVLNDLTRYQVPSSTTSSTFYSNENTGQLALPRVVKTGDAHSIYSLLNTGASPAETVTTFYDASGSPVASQDDSLPAGGWARHDTASILGLPDGFIGTAIVTARAGSSLTSISGLVDEYYKPCVPPGFVNITRIPAGVVHAGDTLRLTASNGGTGPLTYAWTIDGLPAGPNVGTWETTLAQGSHTIGVQATNACGNAAVTSDLAVAAVPSGPDLSTSTLTAKPSSVVVGKKVSYTLVIRNTGTSGAQVTLSTPLLAGTEYQNDAKSSDGGQVSQSTDGTALNWSGKVEPGSPVVITYGLKVVDAALTLLHSEAQLTVGTEQLMVVNNVNVGKDYGLVILDGALATNRNDVDLTLSWNQADNILYYRLSNDPGFGPAGGTSDWLPISPTHKSWNMQVGGEVRLPRTVYVRYRSADGVEYGPFADDIIYDGIPPSTPVIDYGSIVPAPAGIAGGRQPAAAAVTGLVVKTADDNSGVATIQASLYSDFRQYNSYPCTGSQVSIPFVVASGAPFYLRVIDRSGNVSLTASGVGPEWKYLFLPYVYR